MKYYYIFYVRHVQISEMFIQKKLSQKYDQEF